MGGGSFEICGVDVHNRYASLDDDYNEEEMGQKKSWEHYRTYYENCPAPPPTIEMHNSLLWATRRAIWKLSIKRNFTSGNTPLNCDEFGESSVGSKINFDPEYLSLNCDGFETAIRRGRNKPVIGEPVMGGGLADRKLYAEYKKACFGRMAAAVSSSVSTRSDSLSCSGSDSSCNIGSGIQIPGAVEQTKGKITRFCEYYKRAVTAAVSKRGCDCSSIGCHVTSKSSQVDSQSAEKFKGLFDISEVEALKANEAPWVYESGGKRIVEVPWIQELQLQWYHVGRPTQLLSNN